MMCQDLSPALCIPSHTIRLGFKTLTHRWPEVLPTWCSEWQAVVKATGLGGDEEVAEDTDCDEEGQENHRCYGQTYQSPNTGEEGKGGEREGG